jgi:hypothetical protein
MKLSQHLLFIFLLSATVSVQAQVGIGIATPATSAQLDITSTTRGLLIPRMTASQRSPGIVSPAEGLMVYQTDAPIGIYVFKAGVWTILSAGVSNPTLVTRATNLIINSGVYVDVISISLEANKTYFIESVVLGQRVGGTSGPGTFQLVYSGSATTDFGFFVSANQLPDIIIDATPSFDLDVALIPTNFTTTPANKYQLAGYLRTTTAGTLTIRGARAASNTTVDLNVREGTYLLAKTLN